ncbi:hypothetical protein LTR08_004656 [Meristemomyces frigidus]|nr:hypothetical protein LTR08_004656 [Meristemomyces frigidus]
MINLTSLARTLPLQPHATLINVATATSSKLAYMCYFDNYKFGCADWKWGNFRQHCQDEYRTGETCGMKMVYQTLPLAGKCTMCEKIERKIRRQDKHKADYQRWAAEVKMNRAASMENAAKEIHSLEIEIQQLKADKDARYRMIGNTRRA